MLFTTLVQEKDARRLTCSLRLTSGFQLNAHGKMIVPENWVQREEIMIVKKLTLLFIAAAMLACVTSADGQTRKRARSKSTAAQKKAPPTKPAQSTAPQEQKPAVELEAGRMSVEELMAKIAKNEPITIIDGRSESSYGASDKKIKGAIRITNDELESRINEIPRDKEVVIYCA
jgi:hypothetical protein